MALVQWPVQWTLDYSEVAEVFTVPLSVAIDASRYSEKRVERDGQEYTLRSLQWENHTIWGATAAILLNLASRMENANAC